MGGLADAVSGLALACRAAGHDVLVLLPFYSELDTAELVGLAHERDFDAPVGALRDDGELVVTWRRHTAHTAAVAGVPCVLLRPAADSPFGRPYAYRGDEPSAAVAWCRCALEWLAQSGRRVHILHAHEWQAGAACMLYWELGYRGRLGAGVVLTIHNADSAGECRADQFVSCGARPAAFMTPDRALDEARARARTGRTATPRARSPAAAPPPPCAAAQRTRGHNPERMCLLKGGVVFAQAVTTVSRTYRDECVRAGWLGATLAAAGPKFVGITNGSAWRGLRGRAHAQATRVASLSIEIDRARLG